MAEIEDRLDRYRCCFGSMAAPRMCSVLQPQHGAIPLRSDQRDPGIQRYWKSDWPNFKRSASDS